MSSLVVEAINVQKQFGEVLALQSFSAKLASSTCLILLGQNGAGKSTTLRCLSGIIKPTAGQVMICGIDTALNPAGVRKQIGLMPEQPGLYERMSAVEYLSYFGSIYGMDSKLIASRSLELLDRFSLSHAAHRWMGTYSKGMRQKVALIRATLHQPPLIMADEPTSALDPYSARMAWQYLKDLVKQGSSLVVCTHSMEEARALGDQIGIMSKGRLLALGTADELAENAGLKKKKVTYTWPGLEDIYLAYTEKE